MLLNEHVQYSDSSLKLLKKETTINPQFKGINSLVLPCYIPVDMSVLPHNSPVDMSHMCTSSVMQRM